MLPFASLKKWTVEFASALERANGALNSPEFELGDMEELVRTGDDHSSLLKKAEKLIEDHGLLIQRAKARRDASLRGRGMNSLPMEVLRSVFLLACGSPQDWSLPESSDYICLFWAEKSASRFQIAHVNRYWRDIALSIPHLWVTVTLSPSTSPELIAFLARGSGSLPLRVLLHTRFLFLTTSAQISTSLVGQLADLFQPLSARCQVFGVNCRDQPTCTIIIARFASPSWREIYIGTSTARARLGFPTISAPNLSVLWSQDVLNLPSVLGAQLTRLDLSCYIEDVIPTLATCFNLYSAKLHATAINQSGELPTQSTSHQSLTTLHLNINYQSAWQGIAHVLRSLTAPALETLSVSLRYFSNSPDAHKIKSALEDTQGHRFGLANVKSLIYDFRQNDSPDGGLNMLHLLTKFTNLVRLECRDVELALLGKAFRDNVLPTIPPRLETLVLHKSSFTISDDEASDADTPTSSAEDLSNVPFGYADCTISGAADAIEYVLSVMNSDKDSEFNLIFEGALKVHESAIRGEIEEKELDRIYGGR